MKKGKEVMEKSSVSIHSWQAFLVLYFLSFSESCYSFVVVVSLLVPEYFLLLSMLFLMFTVFFLVITVHFHVHKYFYMFVPLP